MSDSSPRFTNNQDGTVTDNRTGLSWLRRANQFGRQTWDDAVASTTALHSGTDELNDGSKPGDWRLPTMLELIELLDFRFERPTLSDTSGEGQWREGDPFVGVNSETLYWSATSAAQDTKTLAWWVHMGSGNLANDYKTSEYYVWPVRGSSSQASPRYSDNRNGTVTDNQTQLVWLKDTTRIGQMLWSDAVRAAEEVKSGMYGLSDGSASGDWRLPTQHELLGLLDYRFVNPAVSNAGGKSQWKQGNAFDNVTLANLYWSSTAYATDTEIAWGALLGTGNASTTMKNGFFFVLPVRQAA